MTRLTLCPRRWPLILALGLLVTGLTWGALRTIGDAPWAMEAMAR